MNSKAGTTLVASLAIMLAIMTFGVASIYLSQTTLGTAESQRAHAMARAGAEAGLEAALVALREAYQATGEFPASLALPGAPDGAISFRLADGGYHTVSEAGRRTRARVKVWGTGPRDARYLAEALFEIVPADDSTFMPGLMSENVVAVDGNIGGTSLKFTNARVHGNQGFELDGDGSYQHCDDDGNCSPLTGDDRPVSAAARESSYTCHVNSSDHAGLCSGGQPAEQFLKGPVTVGRPPYEQIRDAAFGTPGESATTPPCDITTSSLSPSYNGSKQTVCVTRSRSSDIETFRDVTIIVYGNLTLEDDVELVNANIMATGYIEAEDDVALNNSRLFANAGIDIYGNVESTGISTIASGQKLFIDGNVETTDSGSELGLFMLSVDDMEIDGNLEKNEPFSGFLWSGGKVDVNGNVQMLGGITSVGKLTIDGNADVDGRADLVNPDYPLAEEPGITSRR